MSDRDATNAAPAAPGPPRAGPAWGDQPASKYFKGRHWLLVLTFFMIVNIVDAVTSEKRQIEIQMSASAVNGMAQNVGRNDPEGVRDFGEMIIERNLTDSELLTALNQSIVGAAGIDGLLQAARGMAGAASVADDLQVRFDRARNPSIFRQVVGVFRSQHWAIEVFAFIGLGIFFMWLFFRLRRKDLRRSRGECISCGYDLRNNPGTTCSECGKTVVRRRSGDSPASSTEGPAS